MASLRLGVIPAVGSGLASMAQTGQLDRLFVHLGYYTDEFEVTHFTWGDWFEEQRFWRSFYEQTGARLVPLRGWGLSRVLQLCDVLRPMNLLGTIPALYAKARWGIPFVMSYGADYVRIAEIHGRPMWKWKALRAVALRRASRVLVSNQRLAEQVQAQFPSASITHHPNWVDGDRFAPDDRPRPGFPRKVFYVGRLVKEKNLRVLAEAVATLPETRLVCVGAGPEREALTQLKAECVGSQPWTSLPHWYHQADVFALPSLSEGHPKALTEAMACGLPCLVSKAVTEGGDAVWRTAEFAAGIQVLFDANLARHFGQAARSYAMKYWDVKVLMPKEIEYLTAAAR